MEQTSSSISLKKQWIKDLQEKDEISSSFLVKFSAVQTGKSGKAYMNLVLQDKTGEIEARVWENVPKFASQAVKESFVSVEGRCQLFQSRRQIVVKDLKVLREDELNPEDYLKKSDVNSQELYQKLLGYVDSMQDPEYRALAESVLKDDLEIKEKLMRAPAAKTVHHAHLGGLIEHMVSVTGVLDRIADHYGSLLDRDLLFLGAFFHDIGKIWELKYDKITDYTDEGRLIGHLVMGVELVTRKVREIQEQRNLSLSEEKILLIKHVILAHHGRLEYGSPKRPKCLEALVVHMIDDLDSKIHSIQTFLESDLNPGSWTQMNRQYERFFYKPEWARKEIPGE